MFPIISKQNPKWHQRPCQISTTSFVHGLTNNGSHFHSSFFVHIQCQTKIFHFLQKNSLSHVPMKWRNYEMKMLIDEVGCYLAFWNHNQLNFFIIFFRYCLHLLLQSIIYYFDEMLHKHRTDHFVKNIVPILNSTSTDWNFSLNSSKKEMKINLRIRIFNHPLLNVRFALKYLRIWILHKIYTWRERTVRYNKLCINIRKTDCVCATLQSAKC